MTPLRCSSIKSTLAHVGNHSVAVLRAWLRFVYQAGIEGGSTSGSMVGLLHAANRRPLWGPERSLFIRCPITNTPRAAISETNPPLSHIHAVICEWEYGFHRDFFCLLGYLRLTRQTIHELFNSPLPTESNPALTLSIITTFSKPLPTNRND